MEALERAKFGINDRHLTPNAISKELGKLFPWIPSILGRNDTGQDGLQGPMGYQTLSWPSMFTFLVLPLWFMNHDWSFCHFFLHLLFVSSSLRVYWPSFFRSFYGLNVWKGFISIHHFISRNIFSATTACFFFFLLVFMPWMQESTSKCLLKIGLNLLLKAIDSIPFHHLL